MFLFNETLSFKTKIRRTLLAKKPVILTCDGSSLGGFICAAVVPKLKCGRSLFKFYIYRDNFAKILKKEFFTLVEVRNYIDFHRLYAPSISFPTSSWWSHIFE